MRGPSRSSRRPAGAIRLGGAALAGLLAMAAGVWAAPAAPETSAQRADSTAVLLPPGPDGTLAEREFFLLAPDQRPLALAHGSIVPENFVLRVGGQSWLVDIDYRLLARSGQVIPLRDWSAQGTVVAVVEYRFQPSLLPARVGLRPMLPPPAGRDFSADDRQIALPAWTLAVGSELDVRGSKSVQVASGNRRDLTVAQNLRLNISGQLTREIQVQAVLSDDNLPVVPEGNTEKLQDIDQVLVSLTAPTWQATLGDFVALRGGTRFGNYRRKLQGFTGEARFGDQSASVVFGSPRGRYRTVELRGQEANQGPYFLGAGASGQSLFIVAGSERVVMDGQVLTRGSDRDYVIDYVRGTVTFTFRRLVTAESLILVEFEEGEGPYGRTVVGFGAGASAALGAVPVAFGVRLTREADDAGRLRTGELTEQDEATLRQAGDDPLAAVAAGAEQVPAGTGDYVRHVIDDEIRYEFVASGGDWQVAFFYAGAGGGDYVLSRLTETGVRVYTWVGMGQGSWRVGRPLPLPEAQSLLTLTAAAGDSTAAGLRAEWHLSSRDRNRLSACDDDDNEGQAIHLTAGSGPLALGAGTLAASAVWQWRDARFAPFLTDRSVYEFERWGLGDRARQPGFFDQSQMEATAAADWRLEGSTGRLELSGEAAKLKHGESLAGERFAGDGRWRWHGGSGQHRWRQASSQDDLDPLAILRRDQTHDVAWRWGPVVPRLTLKRQSWRDDIERAPAARGWRLEQVAGGLAAAPDSPWRWDLQFARGLADSLRADRWRLERDTRTWQGSLETPRRGGVRATAEATLREVRRPDGQNETARLGRLEIAARWPRLGSDWNLGYGVDNSRAEVLARRVAYVGEGQGRYDEGGNFVGEGQGAYELLLAGTDSLIATTSVRADLGWRQDFGRLGKDRLWGAWLAETRLGVEARSRAEDVGSLLCLRPSAVFDETNTVLGRVDLSEEVTLLRHLRRWDLRWRFDYSEVMDRQYAQGRLDRLRREHAGTLTYNPVATASLRLRAAREDDRRRTDALLNPTQLAYTTLTRRLESEASWRPTIDGRVSLAVELLSRQDDVSGVDQREQALRPGCRWRVRRDWSVQSELRLAAVSSEEPLGARRPYFFVADGTNVDATLRIGWDPNRNLNVNLAWFARKPGGRTWQHDLRIESTARF